MQDMDRCQPGPMHKETGEGQTGRGKGLTLMARRARCDVFLRQFGASCTFNLIFGITGRCV